MWQRFRRWLIPGGLHYSRLHRQLTLFWWDGVYANIAESIALAYTALYALALGATNAQVGQLTAFQNLLGAAALIPGARFSEWWGRRKQLVVWSAGVGGRLTLLALALVPFVFDGQAAIYALMLVFGLRTFFLNFSNPAWTSFTAQLVPARLRGRYFSSRNFAIGVVTFVTVPLVGFLIQMFGSPQGYQVAFGLSFVAGIIGLGYFMAIPEPEGATARAAGRPSGDILREMLANQPFVVFTVVALVWNLSLQIAAPFFNVFLVKELGADSGIIGVTSAVNSVSALIGQRWWGRRYARLGDMGIFRMTGLIIPVLPLFWVVIQAPWQVSIINTIGGFVWAGYTLAQFNLLLSLTPEQGRERYVAFYQTAVFLSAFVGPLIGAALSDALGYRLMFGLTAIGRLAATLMFIRLIAARPARGRDEDDRQAMDEGEAEADMEKTEGGEEDEPHPGN